MITRPHRLFLAVVTSAALGAGGSTPAQERPAAASAGQERMMALEAMIHASGTETLERFIAEHLAPSLRDSVPPAELLALVQDIRRRCAAAAGILLERDGELGTIARFESMDGVQIVRYRLEAAPPHRIAALSLDAADASPAEPQEPWTWDALASRLDAEAAAGVSGVVLVVRDGKTVLHEGYGFADRQRSVPNTPQTLFAIGSTPIDFTKGAILKLADLKRLALADPIPKFFGDSVPADKRDITIAHLMHGASGLPNFHHIPGKDADYDLTWIDKDEAVRRILGQELLFVPGHGDAHSHSAWVLLAAIVEQVSGQAYADFLREQFFVPLGMEHTGLHEWSQKFAADEVAVGEGASRVGEVNSPQHWGNTSWLVMGSGGMVSNPADLHAWAVGIRSGKILSAEGMREYDQGGVALGGDDRGFMCMYAIRGDTMMFVCSNTHTNMGDQATRVGRGLARLVMGR